LSVFELALGAATASVAEARRFKRFWLPLVLALLIGAASLRGWLSYEMVGMDASRHAMNGAFIYDCVRLNHLGDALAFAQSYFSHLPALSMPYHPPLFPAFEALVFALFGLSGTAARLAVAICVAGSTSILYSLVFRTHRSWAMAAAVVVAFTFTPLAQFVATDIMLEYPALLCVLGSLYAFSRAGDRLKTRPMVVSALLAGAGCWTKQTVFLGLVPCFVLLFDGRWRLLFSRVVLLWYAIFAVPLFGYLGLLQVLGWGAPGANWRHRRLWDQFLFNLNFYAQSNPVLKLCALALVAVLIAILLRPAVMQSSALRRNSLYLGCMMACFAVAAVVPAYDMRYLFFALPAFFVVVADGLFGVLTLVLKNPRVANSLLLAAALLFAIANFRPAGYLEGPGEAARILKEAGARRILYCGPANGPFIFGVRRQDPALQIAVVRCDKLPASTFNPATLPGFVAKYGIDYVAVQESSYPAPWTGVPGHLDFDILAKVPLKSSEPQQRGTIWIYRTNADPRKGSDRLRINVDSFGKPMELRLD
jgi:hypothetical protein